MCNTRECGSTKRIEHLDDMNTLAIEPALKDILVEAFRQGASVTLNLAADQKTLTSADIYVQGYHWKHASYMPDGTLSGKFGRGFSMS